MPDHIAERASKQFLPKPLLTRILRGTIFHKSTPVCKPGNSTLTIVIFKVQNLEFSLVFRYAVTTSLGRMVCGNLHMRVFLSSSVHSGEDVRTSFAILVSIWGPNHGCLSPTQVTWSPPTRVDNCTSVNAPSGSHRRRPKQSAGEGRREGRVCRSSCPLAKDMEVLLLVHFFAEAFKAKGVLGLC
jgi:hypothetical protein